MLKPALEAAESLDATVVNMRFVKPLDTDLLREMSKSHDLIVTVEEHQVMGGAGSAVLAELYLDGDYSQPILSQWLDPALADAIRFGDLTGLNNGMLDVDYLRFAQLPEPGGLICLTIAFLFLRQRGKRCTA